MSDNDESQKKVIRKEVEISPIPNFVYERLVRPRTLNI